MRTRIAVLLAAIILAGCNEPRVTEVWACDDIAIAGLNIIPQDSITGARIFGSAINITVRDGSYSESGTWTLSATMPVVGLAWSRAGTYRIDVHALGYRAWTRNGVRVEEDQCNVIPVVVHAQMQPAP